MTISLEEVALLQWHEGGGVKLLGRSGDRDLVDRVRAHLTRKLHGTVPGSAEANLRLVESADAKGTGGDHDGNG